MFRSAIVFIAVLVAASPSASVFCEAWCAPDPAAEHHCHQEDAGSPISVCSHDSCQEATPGAAILTRDEAHRRQWGSGHAGGLASAVVISPPIRSPRPAGLRRRPAAHLTPPFTRPLRI